MTYSGTTSNATNKVTATPTDPNATVEITLNETTEVENGSSAAWEEGSNTLTIKVSAEGNTPTTYTVTMVYST